MAKGIVETLSGAIDRMTLREIDLDRVVKIPTRDIAGTDFNLTDEIREWLYNSGYEAAKEFLSTWTFDEYRRKRTGVAA
jgi:NTE family protein